LGEEMKRNKRSYTQKMKMTPRKKKKKGNRKWGAGRKNKEKRMGKLYILKTWQNRTRERKTPWGGKKSFRIIS
jgi:hypothetical protein